MQKSAEEIADDVLQKIREELPPGTLAGSGIGRGTGIGRQQEINASRGGRRAQQRLIARKLLEEKAKETQ